MQQPSMSIAEASIKPHHFSGCLARRMAAGCPDGPSVAERDPGELPRARRFQTLETLFFWQAADTSMIKALLMTLNRDFRHTRSGGTETQKRSRQASSGCIEPSSRTDKR